MKRFIIAVISVILIVLLLDTAYYRWGFYIDLHKDKQITALASVKDKQIMLDSGAGPEPFEMKGVDLGAGIPGHAATDYAISKKTYLRWFSMIQEMGANTIRVYTMLSDDFYNAVYEYNTDNETPLYVVQGVWINDYVHNSHVDAYDDTFLEPFKKECRLLSDVIHGNRKVNLGYSTTGASGSYTKDISQWVIGYILGVEWEDSMVAFTDHMQEERNEYKGEYMYTTPDASPFEAMLAQVGDSLIRYESDRYKDQRLLAFSNWPTVDPLEYTEEESKLLRKYAEVDVEHIQTTKKVISGQFASYHIYPYYPSYLSYYDRWKEQLDNPEQYRLENGEYNTYEAYLALINQHHTMPVIISEFGVPASRGRARVDYSSDKVNRSQGYITEEEQGKALVECYKDIREAGCAGSIIFSWQDEWFKKTWNTTPYVDLTHTPYWSDYQTNEQSFGLLAFDPGKKESISYTDGDVSEWEKQDLVSENGDLKLYSKYDEKFVYLRIHKDNLDFNSEKLYIPVDVTPKSGSYFAEGEEVKFDRAADFLLIIDGADNTRLMVQKRYNPFVAMYHEEYKLDNPYFNPPDKDSPVFEPITLPLQYPRKALEEWQKGKELMYETGKLTYGNGNPGSADYNSVSDFIAQGDDIEIRLPWELLNFSNPSDMKVHDDYYEKYGIENMQIDALYMGISSEADKTERIPMKKKTLKGWGNHPTYHERLKKSYYAMQDLWS